MLDRDFAQYRAVRADALQLGMPLELIGQEVSAEQYIDIPIIRRSPLRCSHRSEGRQGLLLRGQLRRRDIASIGRGQHAATGWAPAGLSGVLRLQHGPQLGGEGLERDDLPSDRPDSETMPRPRLRSTTATSLIQGL